MNDLDEQTKKAVQEFSRRLDRMLLDFAYTTQDEEQETTTDRDVDAIGAYTLEELFAMNGHRFPFSAVKVNNANISPSAIPLPVGTLRTLVGHARPTVEDCPMYAEDLGSGVVANNRAWQFADPDFDVKD